jgi:pimeloyl-ACP methyl ester carboxylesterase
MATTEHKPTPLLKATGAAASGSIAESGYRRLGGINQWVIVRGENVANPPLILLHGGPGMSETALFRYYNASLEERFTVVYWDQRGAGKSFSRNVPRSSMTVEQFLSDLHELVDAVLARTGQTKVVLFGHSWGSVLGTLYAARHPNKVAAYVGSGQVGDGAAGEEASYAFALAEAQRLGKRRLVEKLRTIGPPPHSGKDVFAQRTALARLDGTMHPKVLWRMYWPIVAAPESSLLDLPAFMRGFGFSLDALWPEASRLNLIDLAPTLQMPVFFFLGRDDHWVPVETSLAYLEFLNAPSKRLVWFENSGHEPFVDEPAKFNALMAELVRPVVPFGAEPGATGSLTLPEG